MSAAQAQHVRWSTADSWGLANADEPVTAPARHRPSARLLAGLTICGATAAVAFSSAHLGWGQPGALLATSIASLMPVATFTRLESKVAWLVAAGLLASVGLFFLPAPDSGMAGIIDLLGLVAVCAVQGLFALIGLVRPLFDRSLSSSDRTANVSTSKQDDVSRDIYERAR